MENSKFMYTGALRYLKNLILELILILVPVVQMFFSINDSAADCIEKTDLKVTNNQIIQENLLLPS